MTANANADASATDPAYDEEELLMISGLQHYVFCRRQWGLIHLEQLWAENVLTFEGRQLHRRADDPYFSETRGDVLITRAMPLVSSSLRMYGVADVVEFHALPGGPEAGGVELPARGGRWQPYPVEYKRGNRKEDDCDEVQLCAQALALEDMLGASVPEGALYYGERERRVTVRFDGALRQRVRELASEMHEAFKAGATARAVYAPKCRSCSLLELCGPRTGKRSAQAYWRQQMDEHAE